MAIPNCLIALRKDALTYRTFSPDTLPMRGNLLHRHLWLKAHRYLGLLLGPCLVVIGLSGSVGLYGDALDTWLNPELAIANPQGKSLSLDRIMAAVRAIHPQRHGSWTLELPRSADGMLTAWYENPEETRGRLYAPLMVSVNPYTAEIVASRFWGETAVSRLSDLHTQLRLGRTGWNWVGGLGFALMVSLVSGLWLWWPGRAELRKAFIPRADQGAGRFALDWHRLFGLAIALPLLALAFTGVNLAFPKLPEAVVGTSGMGHDDEGPTVRSTAIPNDRPVGPEEAVLLARGPFPHAEVRRVTTPEGETGTYRVALRQPWEVNHRHPLTTVWVDQYSGQIREVRNPARFTAGESAITWLWPLHTGEAFGRSGRLIWFIAGLAPALLFLTGLLGWLIRHRWVRDVPVDFAPLRQDIRRWKKTALPLAVRLAQQGLHAASWAIAQVAVIAAILQKKYAEASRRNRG